MRRFWTIEVFVNYAVTQLCGALFRIRPSLRHSTFVRNILVFQSIAIMNCEFIFIAERIKINEDCWSAEQLEVLLLM